MMVLKFRLCSVETMPNFDPVPDCGIMAGDARMGVTIAEVGALKAVTAFSADHLHRPPMRASTEKKRRKPRPARTRRSNSANDATRYFGDLNAGSGNGIPTVTADEVSTLLRARD